MISVRGLTKSFKVHEKDPGLAGSIRSLFRRRWKTVHAVRDVTLEIGEGEIVGLVGANGAGKTTLVKMMAGIIHPSAGQVRVLGYDPWQRDNRLRRQVALVMGQKAQLWWDLPAADCFMLLKEIYGLSREEFRASVDELSALLEVGPQLRTQIRRLSLGERMKMELIAALLHRPRVVYLDEPTIGLDLTAQRAVRDFLLHYRETRRPAMVLTSHYMEDIERLCERIVLVREGEVAYDGSLARVVAEHAPVKDVVARFADDPPPPADGRAELASRFEVVAYEGAMLRIRVPREQVAHAASYVLEHFPVADLAIEALDIGTIIEHIFRSGRRPAPEVRA